MKKIIIVLALLVLVFTMTACDLMFGMFQPDYAGAWSIIEEDTLIDTKITFTFSREAYEQKVQLINADGEIFDYLLTQGLCSGTDSSITLTPEKSKDNTDLEDITFEELEWVELTGDDTEPGTLSWSIEGDELTITAPAETEGDDPTVTVLTKVVEPVE